MFSDEIKYQLDFAKKSKIFYITMASNVDDYKNNIIDLKKFLKSTNSDKISLVNYHECFSKLERLNEVRKIIKEHSDKEILISASTTTSIDNLYEPLVNIFFWKSANIRQDISWNSWKTQISLFDERYYKSYPKTNKGILSVRKENERRNYLFSLINNNTFDGIIRYGKWPWHEDIENNNPIYLNLVNKFPTFLDLISEYKSSYVSFVVETELSDFMNPLTEKTLISFLTKTMPIVLGGKNYIKELKDMGFYVWNDEFGFDADELQSFDLNKVDSYFNCIEKYNQMSKSEISDMYSKNIDKIEHNYNLVSSILFEPKTIL